jgi:ABC-type dipeptide/oligopeptide/nickel transport system permease subunit
MRSAEMAQPLLARPMLAPIVKTERSRLERALHDRLLLLTGGVIGIYVLVGLIGPLIAPQGPYTSHPGINFHPPDGHFLLGTDKEGRDVLSRLLYGTRFTLIGAFGVMAIAALLGFIYGLVTAYVGGWFDSLSMRLFDVILSFPPLVLAIVLVATFGPGLYSVIIGVGIGYLPAIARIIRSEAMVQRNQQYVAAAEGLGFSAVRIIFGHIMPNTTSQIIVQASMNLPYAIIDIAGLSFLGFGIQPPTPDWGGMLAEGQRDLLFAPWLAIAPAAAITVLVLAWNVFGARLRRAVDPKRY